MAHCLFGSVPRILLYLLQRAAAAERPTNCLKEGTGDWIHIHYHYSLVERERERERWKKTTKKNLPKSLSLEAARRSSSTYKERKRSDFRGSNLNYSSTTHFLQEVTSKHTIIMPKIHFGTSVGRATSVTTFKNIDVKLAYCGSIFQFQVGHNVHSNKLSLMFRSSSSSNTNFLSFLNFAFFLTNHMLLLFTQVTLKQFTCVALSPPYLAGKNRPYFIFLLSPQTIVRVKRSQVNNARCFWYVTCYAMLRRGTDGWDGLAGK